MSAHGIFELPPTVNEPILSYAPGTPERADLKRRLAEMQAERIEIPCVIGGKEIRTGATFEVVMPHRKSHVLADVHAPSARCGPRRWLMPRFRALGCTIWRVWAAPARRTPAEPASTRRALHAAAPPPIRPRIGDVTSPRPRAASSRPEEHDLMASPI